MDSPPVRVLIVDDDALVRAGLSMMLASAGDLEVIADVADGAEVVAAVNQHRPDVVLMDIRMPRLDGGERQVERAVDQLPPGEVGPVDERDGDALLAR
ncbi:response regulator, partial [Actinomadura sp. NPDC000929]|uniref:response regulator transcription factor n=1 Tax=Actinomadura sp. NPDC000929 TaxID=3154517 RepID=UPI0033942749